MHRPGFFLGLRQSRHPKQNSNDREDYENAEKGPMEIWKMLWLFLPAITQPQPVVTFLSAARFADLLHKSKFEISVFEIVPRHSGVGYRILRVFLNVAS
jgi:hypothetical protein